MCVCVHACAHTHACMQASLWGVWGMVSIFPEETRAPPLDSIYHLCFLLPKSPHPYGSWPPGHRALPSLPDSPELLDVGRDP